MRGPGSWWLGSQLWLRGAGGVLRGESCPPERRCHQAASPERLERRTPRACRGSWSSHRYPLGGRQGSSMGSSGSKASFVRSHTPASCEECAAARGLLRHACPHARTPTCMHLEYMHAYRYARTHTHTHTRIRTSGVAARGLQLGPLHHLGAGLRAAMANGRSPTPCRPTGK